MSPPGPARTGGQTGGTASPRRPVRSRPPIGVLVGKAVADSLAIPGATVEALQALARVPERVDRLLTVVERLTTLVEHLDAAVAQTGQGIELAGSGIRSALGGIERVGQLLDRSVPDLSQGVASLEELTNRLGAAAGQLAYELPRATASLENLSPELARLVGSLETRLLHLDQVVSELTGTVMSLFGAIPGVRRVVRGNTRGGLPVTPSAAGEDDSPTP